MDISDKQDISDYISFIPFIHANNWAASYRLAALSLVVMVMWPI